MLHFTNRVFCLLIVEKILPSCGSSLNEGMTQLELFLIKLPDRSGVI